MYYGLKLNEKSTAILLKKTGKLTILKNGYSLLKHFYNFLLLTSSNFFLVTLFCLSFSAMLLYSFLLIFRHNTGF